MSNTTWCYVCEAPQWVLPDGSHDCASFEELRSRIADLEDTIKTILEPAVNEQDVKYYEKKKKEWLREEKLNTREQTMMVKPFMEEVQSLQKEIHCDGKTGIASHNIQSAVHVEVYDPVTGESQWAKVKWLEAMTMMGCGCWDGIKLVAELDN